MLIIKRVLIGREVDGPLPICYEGDTTIMPMVEEVIVVKKRMRLDGFKPVFNQIVNNGLG